MIERVNTFLDEHHLRPENSALLVAVSGGIDSMVLLDILLTIGHKPAVAHMNYGLRGADSDGDEQFVQAFCKTNNLIFHAKRGAISTGEGSTQMQARTLRYDWFDEMRVAFGYSRILTAHHLNDSLETTLLHLTKGTGISGLTGIPTDSQEVLRPFALISKTELEEYAKTHGLAWREDGSNQESKYQRNKIRNKVIPVLEEINPALTDTFRHTLERLQGTSALVKARINELRKQYLTISESDTLRLDWYTNDTLGWMLLSELLKPYAVSYVMAKEIGQTIVSGKRFFSESHEIVMDRNRLILSFRTYPVPNPISIPGVGRYEWGSFEMTVEHCESTDFHKPVNEAYAYFDAAALSFPFQVRSWQQGDTFVPLGMSGKKKLSDFMIDNKIALSLKSRIPVFECRVGIFWLGGHRIDDRFKVTEQTKNLIRINLSHRE